MFPAFNLPPLPAEHQGLEETTAQLKRSERKFVHINNNLGINMFKASVQDAVHRKENLVVSLVSATTSLAMIFLGARGVTSWQINELLRYREFYLMSTLGHQGAICRLKKELSMVLTWYT